MNFLHSSLPWLCLLQLLRRRLHRRLRRHQRQRRAEDGEEDVVHLQELRRPHLRLPRRLPRRLRRRRPDLVRLPLLCYGGVSFSSVIALIKTLSSHLRQSVAWAR